MDEKKNHLALNCFLEELDVAVVDDSKFQQKLVRTILQPLRLKRVRIFDTAKEAVAGMQQEVPHLLILDWHLENMPGRRFMTGMRHKDMGPLALVPVLATMMNPTRAAAEEAYMSGAQALIAKPFSQNSLQRRVQWIVRDNRPLKLHGDHYVIDGVNTFLHEQHDARDRQEYKVISETELPEEPHKKSGKAA